MQSATDPNNIILVGSQSARIEYNPSLSQWVYTDPRLNVTARSRATQNSFALGKHNWTISGDKYKCSEDSIELQFQINLENRATYYNLKNESYLNTLSQDEINLLWLPLVVYLNTNKKPQG